jgi:uridine kinase
MDSSSKNALLTEAGRNPWYLPDGTCNPAFVVGLAGGSASGKTSLAKAILHSLALPWVLLLSQDSY